MPVAVLCAGAGAAFPWSRLPMDLQRRIMGLLTMCETAALTCGIKCRTTRAVHYEMLAARHEALLELVEMRVCSVTAHLIPPLDVGDPGDFL